MIRTRFAPSPTGYLHIGGLRTAAYAFALAKHQQGEFLLRIEDTDQDRLVDKAEEKIYEILKTFSLDWDGPVVVQSQRARDLVYQKAAIKLLESGKAFYCQCDSRNAKTEGYSETLRDPCRDKQLTSGAIKLRVPDDEKIEFFDFVLNHTVTWNSNDIADTVLLKSDGIFPTYHLAQAVDDHDSQITHVIRGAEWMTSTPVHILVHRFLGYEFPQIGHPSAILDPDGGKLSKRKGNVSVEDFLNRGYLPEAILNFVILLGWAPKNNRELFTLTDFVQEFDVKGFQKSNPTLAIGKLDWFNGQYIRQKNVVDLQKLIAPLSRHAQDKNFVQLIGLVKERLVTLADFDQLVEFIFTRPTIDKNLFGPDAATHLEFAKNYFTYSDVAAEVKSRGWKVGDFFMSLRIALCGSKFTPVLNDVIQILGKNETLERISSALAMLK